LKNADVSEITVTEKAPATRGLFGGWTRFWFTPADPVALCRLRFLSGLLFICWLLPFSGYLDAFFSLQGWFDRTAYVEANNLPNGTPEPFGWSLLYLVGGNSVLLTAFYWSSLAVFLLFALGIFVRVTAVLSWVMVVSFLAMPAASYDGDHLVCLIAFYMMVGNLLLWQWSRRVSPAERILGPKDIGLLSWWDTRPDRELTPSYGVNLALRLLQVHFVFVVATSALHKLQSGDWWSGMAFWYPLHSPFETTQQSIQAEAAGAVDARLFMMSLAEYLVLAWQLAFPLFAWRKAWRPVLLGGAAIGWLGCIFIYRLPLFGPVYMIGCLSFLTSEEWHGLQGFWRRLTARAPAVAEKRARFQPRMARRTP
jgi:hypothetical protein